MRDVAADIFLAPDIAADVYFEMNVNIATDVPTGINGLELDEALGV